MAVDAIGSLKRDNDAYSFIARSTALARLTVYRVAIKKNDTGEIRIAQFPELEWGEGSWFWWYSGNMSCDCNREAEFRRAGGEPEEDLSDEEHNKRCGRTRFSVLYAESADGEEVVKIDD